MLARKIDLAVAGWVTESPGLRSLGVGFGPAVAAGPRAWPPPS